jgi:hypothetical protein
MDSNSISFVVYQSCSSLVISLVSVSIGLTQLLMEMDMHPGFLRAGWRNELFDFACYCGQASCPGFLHRQDNWHMFVKCIFFF